jgi:aminoglycoside phosphotransferase (APT) family kinase protein
MPTRMITLHPGNVVRKSGKLVKLQEADALRIAKMAGLPVPHVHGTETAVDGINHISMDFVEGQPLSDIWVGLSADQKQEITRQLREILLLMRALPPPEAYIGDCAGGHILDARLYFTHTSPSCRDEQGFNDFLLSGLAPETPSPIRAAFASRLRTHHRIVFTHGDLAPRNIMVQDCKITAIIDWEEAGWYPEYWEYVKFFQRSSSVDGDWRCHADSIFPRGYPDELVDYIAMTRWLLP